MGSIARLQDRLDRVRFARRLGFDPDPWQRDVLTSYDPRILILCSRQAGKSSVASILALHEVLSVPDSLVLILAPSERQARETFQKVIGLYRKLGLYPGSDRKLGLELPNGSRIEALPASGDTIRGYSNVSLLLCDEAARIPDELFVAVRPMLAVSGGRMIWLTTPYTRSGAFFNEWVGENPWMRIEVPATQIPCISEEFLEEERRSMPEREYMREYMTSFIDAEGSVFRQEDIEAALIDDDEEEMFPGGFQRWLSTSDI